MKSETPVTSSETPKRWYQKRSVLIDIVVIIAVVALISIVWWVGHKPKPAPVSAVPQYSGQTLVDQVNKKYGLHDYVGAIHLIQGQKTSSDRATQLLLASAYANSGDNQKALDIYEQQDKKSALSESDAASAASVATSLKQYQKAIDLFQKAKQRANPAGTDQIAIYDYQIKELQKKL